MRIIQIAGKGRVGKTTLANLIAKHSFQMGYIPIVLPFAGAIKEQAAKLNITKEGNSSEYRKFCQELGESKRKEDPDYWVTRTLDKIQEYMILEVDNKKDNKTYWEYILIQDDVRYGNEIALGRDLVATQIFVDSGGRVLEENDAEWRKHESESLANHIETSLQFPNSEYEDMFDVFLDNGGSLDDLEAEVRDEISEWLDVGYLDLEEYDEEAR